MWHKISSQIEFAVIINFIKELKEIKIQERLTMNSLMIIAGFVISGKSSLSSG
jgi:hypothetical protein